MVAPSAPAGGSSTSPGSWYRQENSKLAALSSTPAPMVTSSRQAARWPRSLDRPMPSAPSRPASNASAITGPGV
jgi:hypothetical protein